MCFLAIIGCSAGTILGLCVARVGPTAGRIGNAGAHTDHVNPDRAANKSATFRSGLSPVPALLIRPAQHAGLGWAGTDAKHAPSWDRGACAP